MGYALPNSTYPNPIDWLLVKLQPIYPLDYILIIIFSFSLVMYTLSGIKHIGIRFFCINVSLFFCVTLQLTDLLAKVV